MHPDRLAQTDYALLDSGGGRKLEKFAARETRRGARYNGIILDPPSFGRCSKGQVFKIEQDLPPLLGQLAGLLCDRPLFVIVERIEKPGNLGTILKTANGVIVCAPMADVFNPNVVRAAVGPLFSRTVVRMPAAEWLDSLNVSAAAILIYEALRQRIRAGNRPPGPGEPEKTE